MAVPRKRPFVVSSEKAEESKNSRNTPEESAFIRELAETFRKNNLVEEGPVLKKLENLI